MPSLFKNFKPVEEPARQIHEEPSENDKFEEQKEYFLKREAELLNEVKRANEAKNDFLANMSHEIRTPINVMLGMNEMITRECTDPSLLEYASKIDAAGRNLLSMVNDILDFSKLDSGTMKIMPVDYDISNLLNDCLNLIQMKAEEKGLSFNIENDGSIPSRLFGDEVRVRQVITNLLSNAVQYTDTGSVTLRVGWRKENEGQMTLFIYVTDTGRGISRKSQEGIFEAFSHMEQNTNRSIKGAGLGLTISKRLLDMMNGSIDVTSEVGKGSEFYVEIPQIIVDEKPMGRFADNIKRISEDGKESVRISFRAPEASILVVDDIKMNIDVVRQLLKKTEISIDTALGGYEAIEKVHAQKFDLILLDHMMPEMDGIDVLKAIRSTTDHENTDTPVVVLTANAVAGAREEYLAAGFDDYMSKPVHYSDLEAMVLKYIPEEYVEKIEIASRITNAGEVSRNGINAGQLNLINAPVILSDLIEQLEDSSNFTSASIGTIPEFSMIADKEKGVKICAGEEEFYNDMIEDYLEEADIDAINDSLKSLDWSDYYMKLHRLSVASAATGADGFADEAGRLADAVKTYDFEYVRDNHMKVMADYESVLDTFDDYLLKLR